MRVTTNSILRDIQSMTNAKAARKFNLGEMRNTSKIIHGANLVPNSIDPASVGKRLTANTGQTNSRPASPDPASEGANRGVALGAGQLYDR